MAPAGKKMDPRCVCDHVCVGWGGGVGGTWIQGACMTTFVCVCVVWCGVCVGGGTWIQGACVITGVCVRACVRAWWWWWGGVTWIQGACVTTCVCVGGGGAGAHAAAAGGNRVVQSCCSSGGSRVLQHRGEQGRAAAQGGAGSCCSTGGSRVMLQQLMRGAGPHTHTAAAGGDAYPHTRVGCVLMRVQGGMFDDVYMMGMMGSVCM